jgi:hypothetical protein
MTTYEIVVITAGEWSALYVDGKLDRVGDSYLAEERIHELYEITDISEVDGARFVLPRGCHREDVPDTLDAARQMIAAGELKLAKAAEMREQAKAMLAEADRLEGKA